MEMGRLAKEVIKWSPQGRRKRGRPKFTCGERVRRLKWRPDLRTNSDYFPIQH